MENKQTQGSGNGTLLIPQHPRLIGGGAVVDSAPKEYFHESSLIFSSEAS